MSNEHEEQEGLQMSFLDHLDELRQRLILSVIAIAVTFALCFTFSDRIFNFLAVPVKREMCKEQLDKQATYGQPKLDSLNVGQIVQYSFAQQTATNNVTVPVGTTIRCKVVTTNGNKSLVLADTWTVGKNTIAAETPLSEVVNSKSLVGCGELVLLGVASGFRLYMRVALYVGLGLGISLLVFRGLSFCCVRTYCPGQM